MKNKSLDNPQNQKAADTDHLIRELTDDDEQVRLNARSELVKIGQPAITPLLKQLRSPDKWARWEAGKTLAEIRKPPVAPYLVESLSSNDPDIRWLSAEGLIALGRDSLVSLLEALTRYSGGLWLGRGAHHVLHDLSKGMVHEGEHEYTPINPLNEELRSIIKPVLNSLEGTESSMLTQEYAKIAIDQLKNPGAKHSNHKKSL